MFTKKMIEDILKERKNKKFIIKTNIAKGKGINGVNYIEFKEIVKYYSSTIKNKEVIDRIYMAFIDKIDDTYIKISTSKIKITEDRYGNKIRKTYETIEHYVPLEKIVSICFRDDEEWHMA